MDGRLRYDLVRSRNEKYVISCHLVLELLPTFSKKPCSDDVHAVLAQQVAQCTGTVRPVGIDGNTEHGCASRCQKVSHAAHILVLHRTQENEQTSATPFQNRLQRFQRHGESLGVMRNVRYDGRVFPEYIESPSQAGQPPDVL